MEVQQEEVGTAPPMPDTEVEVGDQPEEEEANSSDPNHDLGTTAKERAINSLVRTSPTTSFEIDDRVLTFCVLCGDPRHTMTECQYDQDAMPAVTLGIEIMRAALLRYPRHQRVPQHCRLLLNHRKTGRHLWMLMKQEAQSEDQPKHDRVVAVTLFPMN